MATLEPLRFRRIMVPVDESKPGWLARRGRR